MKQNKSASNYNLSEWALKNTGLMLYFMLLLAIVGMVSYSKLAQSEDPPFTFKVMVVHTYWPGASAAEVSLQVTDRIEKELMSTGSYERIMAFTRPGESMVTFVAKDSLRSSQIPDVWYQVRKKVNDIKGQLPSGVQGPFFNDEFGDTFGNIYVLTGADYDYALLKEYADRLQLQLQRVKDVGKVNLVGLQDQKIWIELSNTKAAQLGIPISAIQQALQQQNSIANAGFFETGSDRIQMRVSGALQSVDELKLMPLLVGGKTIQLGDVAEVYRGFSEPAQPRMRFMGKNGIGIAVSMRKGGEFRAPTVAALVQNGIPVLGHIGLTPQSVKVLGHRVQGRGDEAAQQLVADARAIAAAGAFAIVLEAVPADLGAQVSAAVDVPVIGIGAGPGCDGQILVINDVLGLSGDFKPKFVKVYADLGRQISAAAAAYKSDVAGGAFPGPEHCYER